MKLTSPLLNYDLCQQIFEEQLQAAYEQTYRSAIEQVTRIAIVSVNTFPRSMQLDDNSEFDFLETINDVQGKGLRRQALCRFCREELGEDVDYWVAARPNSIRHQNWLGWLIYAQALRKAWEGHLETTDECRLAVVHSQ